MNRFEPMKRPRPTAERESWVTYANSLERRVEAASSYIDRLPMNWRELEARVAELEAALQEIADLNYGEGMGDAMVQVAQDALEKKGQSLDS